MDLVKYYKELIAKIAEDKAKLADKNLDFAERAELTLEVKSLEQRNMYITKYMSELMNENVEKDYLKTILTEDNLKEIERNYAISQNKAYIAYLVKEGNKNLSAEERVDETYVKKMTVEQMAALVEKAGGKEKVEELKFKGALCTIPTTRYKDKELTIIEEYSKHLSEEQKNVVFDKLERLVPPTKISKELGTTKEFDKEIQALKNGISEEDLPTKENGEKYTAEEMKELLDFANEELTVADPTLKIDEIRVDLESIQESASGKMGMDYIDSVPEFKDIVKTEAVNTKTYVWKGPDNEKNIKGFMDLKKVEIKLSEDYKKNVKYMLKRIDEINNVQVGLDGEQGTKAYAFTKLANVQIQLKEAIRNGNKAEIYKTAVEYKKAYTDMKELFDFAKENFSKNPIIYSGNMDVARNSDLPFEFRQDLKTASQINSCFSALTFIKNNNLTADQFLDNVRDTFLESSMPDKTLDLNYIAKQPYKEKVVTEVVNGVETQKTVMVPRTFGEMYKFILSPEYDAVVTNKSVDYAGSRALDGIIKNCPDEEVRNNNMGALMALSIVKGGYSKYVDKGKIGSNSLAIQNLIFMPDDERDYVKALPGNEAFNPVTGEIESGKFDIFEHLNKTQIDFKEFQDKIQTIFYDFYKDKTVSKSGEELIGDAQLAAAKLLVAKMDEKDMPGYAELKEFVEDPYSKVDAWRKEWGVRIDLKDTARMIQTARCSEISEKFKTFINNPKFEKDIKTTEKQLKDGLKTKENEFKTKLKTTENKENVKAEMIESLKDEFNKGKITEYYLKARTEQIKNGNTGKLPSMFRIDDFPKRKNYVPNLSAEEMDGLTKEDIDIIYEHDKERAQLEKTTFLRRSAMEKAGVVEVEDRKIEDAATPVMSNTVLVEKENGFETVEIDQFYAGLEEEIVENNFIEADNESVIAVNEKDLGNSKEF